MSLGGGRARWLAGITVAAVLSVLWSHPARAWYFPEHAELTRLALRDYAPASATRAIQSVVRDAYYDGLDLCPEATTALHALETSGDAVTCIPYGALPAIAADHANTVVDLRATLSTPIHRLWPASNAVLGALLTKAAKDTWESFQDSAPTDVVRGWTADIARQRSSRGARPPATLSPRDYVRSLDVALFSIDSQYVSRAKNAKTHFHDPTSTIEVTLAQAAVGDLDNALAQALAHHARSLQLAARSRIEPDALAKRAQRTEALLEHAFAVHFIEDGLASGHIVTDPAVAVDQRRAQRHDYFNRQGVAVTRSLAKVRCDSPPPLAQWSGAGLDLCWVAHGDGFASSDDRLYVGEAVARLQTAFALALESDLVAEGEAATAKMKREIDTRVGAPECQNWSAEREPDEGCDIAWETALLDPTPALTGQYPVGVMGATGAERVASWALLTRRRFMAALKVLRDSAPLLAANAGLASVQPGVLNESVVGSPLDALRTPPTPTSAVCPAPPPCPPPGLSPPVAPASPTPPAAGSEGLPKDAQVGQCPAAHACVPSSDVIGFLWLPLLTAWPDAQADATTLEGTDSFGRGIKLQVLASLAATYEAPFQNDSSLVAWAGIGGGVSYTAQGVFPRRHTRAIFELNAGVAQGVTVAGEADRFRSLGVLEVRAPVTTLLLYGIASTFRSAVPLRILGRDFTFGLLGGRAYWLFAGDRPRLNGWDLEIFNFLLSPSESPRPEASADLLESEGRVRIGWRSDNGGLALSSIFGGSFVVALEINSGLFF